MDHISLPKCLLVSFDVAKTEIDVAFINQTEIKALKDTGADLSMISEDLVESMSLQRRKLPRPIVLDSIDKTAALTLEEFVEVPLRFGNAEHVEKLAVASIPPVFDVIVGKPWIESRCPKAVASLRNYGKDTESPIPLGPCRDPKVAYSAGGDLSSPTQKLLAAIESEENNRAQAALRLVVQHLEELSIRAIVNKACNLDDEGYFSDNEAETRPLPPIRGLKPNPEGWRNLIPTRFHQYLDVFEDVTPDTPAVDIPGYNCDIKLKEGAILKSNKPYQMTAEEKAVCRKLMDHRLRLGIIEPSTADHGVPVFFVKDPPSEGRNDGQRQMRLVDDLRDLNANIPGLAFPLPRIEPMVNRLAGSKRLRSFDVKSGYDGVPLEPGCRSLTTFVTPDNLYQWTRMPQGLKTAPAIFQRRMEHIFHHLIDKEKEGIFIYIDDFFIYADDSEGLDRVTTEVLETARKYGIRFSPAKATWEADELKCLGFVIKKGKGVFMAKDKVALIHAAHPPRRVADVQHLQGTINFYNRFIPHFADKAACITDLLKKDVPWDWTTERQGAWDAMCKWVREDHYLQPWVQGAPVTLYTDASDYALGALIMQPKPDDPSQLGLVYCTHRKFRNEERGWGGPDKELFAIIHAIEEFRYLLVGSHVEIRTDHRNLAAFMFRGNLASHDGRRGRWWERLASSGVDFIITPIPGTQNDLADFLSRFGYPDSAVLEGKAVLELERFSPKALADISSWFRFEGRNIREKLEEAFASGDKKKGRHLTLTAEKIEGQADEIDTYLGSFQQTANLNDSADPAPQCSARILTSEAIGRAIPPPRPGSPVRQTVIEPVEARRPGETMGLGMEWQWEEDYGWN